MKNTIHDDNNTRVAVVYICATNTHQYSLWQTALRLHCSPSCSMLTARPPSTDHINHSQMSNARSSGGRDDPQAQGPLGGGQTNERIRPTRPDSPAGHDPRRTGDGEKWNRGVAPAQGNPWARERLADGYDSGAQHSQPQHDQQQCGAHSPALGSPPARQQHGGLLPHA